MLLPDTSVWIEFLRGHEQVRADLTPPLQVGNVLAVECVFGELLQGARSPRERRVILGYWANLPRVSQEGLWVEAGVLASRHRLFARGVGLIDAVILLAARRGGAALWTFDRKLAELDGADLR